MIGFLKDFSLGQYVPGNSQIHRMDARMKIVLSFLFIVNVFMVKNLTVLLMLFLFILFLVLLARLKFFFFLKGLRAIVFLLVIVAFFNLFFIRDGSVIYEYGVIRITDKGMEQTARNVGRLMLLVMSTTLLTLTTSPVDLTYGLEKILGPLSRVGFPVHEFALMMTISLRFIPILARELDKIIKAQTARGIDLSKGSLPSRLRKISSLLLPLFFNSFRRADDLALAMEVRCYTGGEGRTSFREYSLKAREFLALAIFCSMLLATRADLVISLVSRFGI